ncbi:hypothetical protein [Mesorhizobium sp. SP-1A]|uniref:hypothetical protein n=1 Tax=Mesorhizobium sp. SP-1A TaxID=3077840 RepID=UPI0028F6E902|nr:hypothetical protein [Mesorhizobium sp. SP-1A]
MNIDEIQHLLEPKAAESVPSNEDAQLVLLLSCAISLKRLADFLVIEDKGERGQIKGNKH